MFHSASPQYLGGSEYLLFFSVVFEKLRTDRQTTCVNIMIATVVWDCGRPRGSTTLECRQWSPRPTHTRVALKILILNIWDGRTSRVNKMCGSAEWIKMTRYYDSTNLHWSWLITHEKYSAKKHADCSDQK